MKVLAVMTYFQISLPTHNWDSALLLGLERHDAAQPSTGISMKSATTGMIGITLITALFTGPLSASSEDLMHDRGRYLLKISGCNDCHTPGYAQSGGAVPEKEWLTGDSLGWRGPWGTTYPSNLRRYMQTISEEQWLARAKTRQYRPPMPWFALRDMS